MQTAADTTRRDYILYLATATDIHIYSRYVCIYLCCAVWQHLCSAKFTHNYFATTKVIKVTSRSEFCFAFPLTTAAKRKLHKLCKFKVEIVEKTYEK